MSEKKVNYAFHLFEKEKDFSDSLIHKFKNVTTLFEKEVSISLTHYRCIGKKKVFKYKGYTDKFIKEIGHFTTKITSKKEDFTVTTGTSFRDNFFIGLGLNKSIFDTRIESPLQLFKNIINLLESTEDAYISETGMTSTLFHDLYKPAFWHVFLGRKSTFKGFLWLTYLSPQELALNGGNRLFELPYATKIEALNGGILIQINDTPEDCLTEEGQERLYKATEWVYNLIREDIKE